MEKERKKSKETKNYGIEHEVWVRLPFWVRELLKILRNGEPDSCVEMRIEDNLEKRV